MSRQAPIRGAAIAVVLAILTGCQPQQPFYFKHVDDANLSHWKGVATEIEYPDVESDRIADVSDAKRPLSLVNNKNLEFWDLTLEEAMRIALTNNRVMRNIGGQIQGPPDFLLRNPELVPTMYDPALADSNPRTGTEAALAAFDAQWSNSLMWQKYDTPQNVNNFSSQLKNYFTDINAADQSVFQTKITKAAATGGVFEVAHNVTYNNYHYPNVDPLNSKEYTTDWNVNLEVGLRQPLLQGAGVQFNRIAGPGATPGMFNGVMLARINTDIALADFEAGVRNLVGDVEVAYWELYFQYRSLDAVNAGRESALSTWRKIYTLYRIGGKGGEADREAQARAQYYSFRSAAEQSQNNLYSAEAKLRYLLGLAATDGRMVRPKDEPTTAKVVFDWYEVLNEGLARSVELREQKFIVKNRELSLIAAKNFLLPKLDFVAQYKWLGFGNRIDGTGSWNSSTEVEDTNAYRTLTGGAYQEWQTGFQMNVPIGFRREMAGVRNAQLALAKERAKLQEGELELSHQLAYAVRQLEADHVLSETDYNRRVAAKRQVEAVAAAYETDTVTIDVLLKAQQELAQAESDYFRALVDYNKAISQVHFRKGSLLEYNGVFLAEGPWPAKAYFDATRRAKAREASTYLDYGFTQPKVLSRGPVEQHPGTQSMFDPSEGNQGVPTLAPGKEPSSPAPEPVPTPEPEPMPTSDLPAAPQPVAEPPRSTSIGKKSGDWNVAKKSSKRIADQEVTAAGWNATKKSSKRATDQEVTATGWNAVERGENRESGSHPSTAAVDRSASGWKGVQH